MLKKFWNSFTPCSNSHFTRLLVVKRPEKHNRLCSHSSQQYVCSICLRIFQNEEQWNNHLKSHQNEITNKLRSDPESTYFSIFGKNIKAVQRNQLRWPDGLIVNTEESTKRGLWYDFKKGVGGGPIQAIMYSRNVSYSEAIRIGYDLSKGISDEFDFEDEGNRQQLREKEMLDRRKRIEVSRVIWKLSLPISKTMGQVYLEKYRKIPSHITK